jgi:hypothetical protein
MVHYSATIDESKFTTNNLPFTIDNSSSKIYRSQLFILITGLLFFNTSGHAQTISASIDRNKILIGEQVTLQLKAEDINSRMSFLQSWFNIPDTAAHLQVVKREAIDTADVGGLNTYVQNITITSFDSGKWKLGPLQLTVQDRTTGKQTILKTDSVILEVLPVDVSGMENYHDVKDIIAVEAKPDYTLYIAIVLSAIVLAILVWLLIKSMKKKKEAPAKPVYKGTPLERALQQIKELQSENLFAQNQVKLFYVKLTDICRNYFSDQLLVRSSQATSDELMVLIGVYLQNEKMRTPFFQFLRLADVVKFAKYTPSQEQNNEAVETAIKTLQHVDALTQRKEQHA